MAAKAVEASKEAVNSLEEELKCSWILRWVPDFKTGEKILVGQSHAIQAGVSPLRSRPFATHLSLLTSQENCMRTTQLHPDSREGFQAAQLPFDSFSACSIREKWSTKA